MIYVYTNYSNIDKDKVIKDNEAAFVFTSIEDTPISRMIISEIDEGTYVDKDSYLDRFGYRVYTSQLSTGSKTLFNILNNPDKIFYAGEMGDNAIELLPKLGAGSIFIENTERLESIINCDNIKVVV